MPELARVQAEYQSRTTISLPDFHRAWGPLARLAAAIETYLDHAVHTNIYITPGAVSGFGRHYDVHDVFTFQISGAPHWKIYPLIFDLPHAGLPSEKWSSLKYGFWSQEKDMRWAGNGTSPRRSWPSFGRLMF